MRLSLTSTWLVRGAYVAALAFAVPALAGCGGAADTPAPTGHVRGTALAGPTCPVQRVPADPACADRPVVGTAQFRRGDKMVTTAVINPTGQFTADLEVGRYTVTIDVGNKPFPVCQATSVDVTAAATTSINIVCDTGIR